VNGKHRGEPAPLDPSGSSSLTIAYLIDPDWASHHLNGHQRIIQRLQALQHEGLGLSG
jgi:hypothetical protein